MTARSSGRFGERSNTSRLRRFRLRRANKINLAKMRRPSLTTRLQFVSCRIMCEPVLPITQLRREWFCKPIFKPAQNRSLDICLNPFSILSMLRLPSDEADDLPRNESDGLILALRSHQLTSRYICPLRESFADTSDLRLEVRPLDSQERTS